MNRKTTGILGTKPFTVGRIARDTDGTAFR